MDRISRIVVATDFSALSQSAIARAVTLAALDGASIHLVHALSLPLIVSPYDVAIPPDVFEELRRSAERQIEQQRQEIAGRGVKNVTAEISEASDPTRAIDAAVRAHRADLVVMGTHGHRGLEHAILGSVAERTLRSVERPVLAVKEEAPQAARPIERILLAVDFSPDSDHAVEIATGLAARLGAHVDVLHVLGLPSDHFASFATAGFDLEEKIRANVAEALDAIGTSLEKRSVPVTLVTRPGRPSAVIAEVAKQSGCQLIAMGSRGRSGLAHVLLGSVAERTLRLAPCSVLVARSPASE